MPFFNVSNVESTNALTEARQLSLQVQERLRQIQADPGSANTDSLKDIKLQVDKLQHLKKSNVQAEPLAGEASRTYRQAAEQYAQREYQPLSTSLMNHSKVHDPEGVSTAATKIQTIQWLLNESPSALAKFGLSQNHYLEREANRALTRVQADKKFEEAVRRAIASGDAKRGSGHREEDFQKHLGEDGELSSQQAAERRLKLAVTATGYSHIRLMKDAMKSVDAYIDLVAKNGRADAAQVERHIQRLADSENSLSPTLRHNNLSQKLRARINAARVNIRASASQLEATRQRWLDAGFGELHADQHDSFNEKLSHQGRPMIVPRFHADQYNAAREKMAQTVLVSREPVPGSENSRNFGVPYSSLTPELGIEKPLGTVFHQIEVDESEQPIFVYRSAHGERNTEEATGTTFGPLNADERHAVLQACEVEARELENNGRIGLATRLGLLAQRIQDVRHPENAPA